MSSQNISLLYVTRHLPCPASTGVKLRVLNIGKQLSLCADVTFLYVGEDNDPTNIEASKKAFPNFKSFSLATKPIISLRDHIIHKIEQHWPYYYSKKVTSVDERHFSEIVAQHDIVWYHTLAAADCFRHKFEHKAVLDFDDLLSEKITLARQTGHTWRYKIGNSLLLYKWKNRENGALRSFKRIIVCSDIDKQKLNNAEKIDVIPNGFSSPKSEKAYQPQHYLGFIGTLNYPPNVDSLFWFGTEVWPIIQKEYPNLEFRIVGKPNEAVASLQFNNFNYLGFIADPTLEYAKWNASLVPLRIGGGTRIKIIEAFSQKCPVISTDVGAYGIDCEHDKDILIASNKETFAAHCINILKDCNKGKEIADAGWKLFQEKYCWDIIEKSIKRTVEKMKNQLLEHN